MVMALYPLMIVNSYMTVNGRRIENMDKANWLMIKQSTLEALRSNSVLMVSDLYHGSGILCDENGNIYDGEFVREFN